MGAPKPKTEWHYPNDKAAILSHQPPAPYRGNGLPEGVVSIITKYRNPGLLVSRPGRSDYWRFDSVVKLYYRGRLFAIAGAGTCFSQQKHEMGCVNSLVIYDEDGDGKLESTVDINDGQPPFAYHIPTWLQP